MSDQENLTVENVTEKPMKIKARGTREEVFNGLAKRTNGNLTADDIELKGLRYVSKKASAVAKQNAPRNLPNLKAKTTQVKKEVSKIESKLVETETEPVKAKRTRAKKVEPVILEPVVESKRVTRSRSKK